ncbi:MAG TPA: hypothetical protein VGM31_06865 [Puia sp.]|jgi:hypothetical protein
MFTRFGALTDEPKYFLDFLKLQDQCLHARVMHLITFEEVSPNAYRLQKLYKQGTWDDRTETALDVLWWDYCHRNY